MVHEACYRMQLLPFYLDLPLDATGTVYHQFGHLNTNLLLIPSADFVHLQTSRSSSSCSSSARASVSLANHRLVIFLSSMLTIPSCSSRASFNGLFEEGR